MKILVVDDEQDLCEILQYNLELEGYEVYTVTSAEEALCLPLQSYDLILLDVMMGGMSGLQLAKILRAQPATRHLPIIFVTALGAEEDMIRGLNCGADDYISKPISLRALKARVQSVLRRFGAQTGQHKDCGLEQMLTCGSLCLNTTDKVATLDGSPLSLTRLEFELLAYLLSAPGKLFSRQKLLENCWPRDTYVLPRTVDVTLARLRKKIGSYGTHIKARSGYGYLFEK